MFVSAFVDRSEKVESWSVERRENTVRIIASFRGTGQVFLTPSLEEAVLLAHQILAEATRPEVDLDTASGLPVLEEVHVELAELPAEVIA